MGDRIPDDPIPAPHNADSFVNHFSPKIIPELQNQSVISVVVGDYHYGALTATGRLLTWGAFSRGALGLGDPVTLPPGSPGAYATQAERDQNIHERWGVIRPPADVLVPAEVRFDHRERRPRAKFCFAAAALGWHTGALIIDLDVSDLPFPIRGRSFLRRVGFQAGRPGRRRGAGYSGCIPASRGTPGERSDPYNAP